MSQEPKVTRFGADPTVDQELATKAYVDNTGGGATITTTEIRLTSNFTTTSTVAVDITGITITLTNVANGGAFIGFYSTGTHDASNGRLVSQLEIDGVDQPQIQVESSNASDRTSSAVTMVNDTDGSVIQARGSVSNAGTGTWRGAGLSARGTVLSVMEVS